MDRIELVRHAVEQHLGDISNLLAMRLLFPPDHMVVTIEKEIRDLYTYPERLETSHRDEWKSIAVKALHRNGFTGTDETDQQRLNTYLLYLRKQAIPGCVETNRKLFTCLEEILAIQRAVNTVTFRAPKRKASLRQVWPSRE